MSVPVKYREIGDFHEYYSGRRKAPYLTVFVGGNHEASNHLWELYYGGWVAPNIYYLGAANVVRFGPLRIAGLSGIWKGYNYNKPHYERLPYSSDDIKSIYHVRELDVRKLLQIRTQVDVGISHDWPRGVEWMGNWKALFAKKDLFEADARAGTLGSSAAKYVMDRLRPPYWFSAHLHCKFAAVVDYGETKDEVNPEEIPILASLEDINVVNSEEIDLGLENEISPKPQNLGTAMVIQNNDEIDLEMDDEEPLQPDLSSLTNTSNQTTTSQPIGVADSIPLSIRAQLPASFNKPTTQKSALSQPPPSAISNKTTHFLALDKCLPHRKFLQIISLDTVSQPQPALDPPFQLSYDKEWLAITRVFAAELELGDISAQAPKAKGEAHYLERIVAEEQWIDTNIVEKGLIYIPLNFETTAPVYDPEVGTHTRSQPKEYTNPQTATFCKLVGIENKFHATDEEREERLNAGPREDGMQSGHGWARGDGNGRGRGRGGSRGRGNGWGRGRGRGRVRAY